MKVQRYYVKAITIFTFVILLMLLMIGSALSDKENDMRQEIMTSNVSSQVQSEITDLVQKALYKIRIRDDYEPSWGVALMRITGGMKEASMPVVRETRIRGLYTYYINFDFINSYISLEELRIDMSDYFDLYGLRTYGLISHGELCVYYDKDRDKIIHIDYTHRLIKGVLLAYKSVVNPSNEGLDYTAHEYEDYIGIHSTMANLGNIDKLNSLPQKKVEDLEAVRLINKHFNGTEMALYNVKLVDRDGFNRFLFELVDPLTDECAYTVYMCVDTICDKFYVNYQQIGAVSTEWDIMPDDNKDKMESIYKTDDYFCWGMPVWLGVSVVQDETEKNQFAMPSDGYPGWYCLCNYGYVSASNVNFREEPFIESRKIDRLGQYTLAKVLDIENTTDGDWYHVRYNGIEGYLKGDYFRQFTVIEAITFIDSDEYRMGIRNNKDISLNNTLVDEQGSYLEEIRSFRVKEE